MEKKKAKNSKKSVKTTKVNKVVKEETKVEEVPVKKTAKKSNHQTFKVLAIVILVVALLTWFIKGGTWDFTSSDAISYVANEEATRTGIHELFLSVYYAINYYLIQIVFLAILGIFYGVISKTNGYKAMVKKIANLFKGKTIAFTLIISLLIAVLTSIITQPIVVITFIPLLYSVAKELKINKVSAMMMTFGALAVGLMGTTIGTYGLYYAGSYMGVEIASTMAYRLIILLAAYITLNVFVILYNKKHSNAEIIEETFEVVEEDKKAKSWPYFVMFGVLFVLVVLGYIGWSSVLGIEVFDNFHEWLTTKVVIGSKSTPIFGNILGKVSAFGSWDPYAISYIMLIILVLTKFIARIKWDELLDNALVGLKKMAKPIALVALAYSVFVLCYWSGITTTIVNFFNQGENFNPYFTTIGNLIADFLHVDMEYTGFVLGSFYAAKYASYTEQIMAILAATNGLIEFIAPTSVFMLIGLSLSKLSYKEYAKSIWKFLVALLIVVCLILTVITYL